MKNRVLQATLFGSLVILAQIIARADSMTDERTVAALDTEYQAAVKSNDAATMSRILADDFVVVTGSGTVYTKADLLQMARAERIHYEHQEETEQPSGFGVTLLS